MRVALRRLLLPTLVPIGIACMACPLTRVPPPCCGNLDRTPPVRVRATQQIATRAEEVPIELQGCKANHEEITAIALNGTLAGCSTVSRGARMVFPTLDVEFTTDSARCQGTQGLLAHRLVTLTNVVYSASIQPGPPACISNSSVTGYTFESHDPGFTALFTTAGPQTLLPILDRYALGWASSLPRTCPPTPTFGGTTSRCPS
jgi:hypothetical protein